MIIKKTFLLMLAAFFCAGLMAQQKYVVIETTFGEKMVCQFGENPRLMHENDYVVLKTTRAEIRYQATEIKKVYIYDETKTGIDAVNVGNMRMDGEQIYFQGFASNEQVRIYTIDGKMTATFNVDTDGVLTVPLESLRERVSIIKTKNQTFKIIRK